jgi:translation initiation factor IF-3
MSDGSMNNCISLSQAIKIAEDEGMDVVEVSTTKSGESICKLMDYGKLVYSKCKKEKKNQKKQHHLKEIRYGLNIGDHDLNVKHDKIVEFIDKNYTVKYVLELRGREKGQIDDAKAKMIKNLENFKDIAQWKDPQISDGGGKVTISTTLHQI